MNKNTASDQIFINSNRNFRVCISFGSEQDAYKLPSASHCVLNDASNIITSSRFLDIEKKYLYEFE